MSSFVTPNDAVSSSSSSSYSPPATMYTTSPVIIAFSLGILICFFLGFCVIYLCRCCFMNSLYAWAFQRTASDNLAHRFNSPTAVQSPSSGLDPLLLRIFPTFPYSSVREFHDKNKNPPLECAICLLEFEDDSLLRLLTVCYHVFHQDCIDLWLRTHKTCPVCRTELDSPAEKCHENVQIINREPLTDSNDTTITNDIIIETRIDIVKDEDGAAQVSTSQQVRERETEGEGKRKDGEEGKRFSRSHSTGHSIVVIKGEGEEEERRDYNMKNDDKYTLILPEHIQIKLIKGGHNYTKSCATYKEMTILCSKCSFAEVISGCSSCDIGIKV